MAAKKKIVAIAMLCMAMVVFSRCNWKKEFQSELPALKSLQLSLDSVINNSAEISPSQLEAAYDTIEYQITFIQNNFQSEMKKEMAEKLSAYRNIPEILPNPSEQWVNVLSACSMSKKQLEDLQQVISSESNVDSLGNSINAAYVTEAIKAEKAAAQKALNYSNEYKALYLKSLEEYSQYQTQIKVWIDSLKLQMAP
ncbi:MAG: hypothetical protein R2809_13255 [Flavobacteriales bacterium]